MTASQSAPPVLELRPPDVGVDEPALLALHVASSGPDALDPLSTLEWFPRDVAAITREITGSDDAARAAILGEVDGQVVGHALTRAWTERGNLRVYLHLERVLPGWRGRGVELALIDWAESHIRALACGPDQSGPWVYGANATSAEVDLAGALLARGYRPAFPMVEMARAGMERLPEPPVPGDFELVPVEPAHLRAVWESIDPAYDDPGSVAEAPTEEGFRSFADDPANDLGLWRVAWSGDRVAGMALGEVAGDRGEITEVNVQPEHRRRGLAGALLARAVNALIDRGVRHVRLHARGNNQRALPLYRSLGFTVLKEHVRYRKPGGG